MSKAEEEGPAAKPKICSILGEYISFPRAINGIGNPGVKYPVQQYVQDALAGTTVAMILVPEAVAFSFMAGLKPLVGLQAAWLLCLIAGLTGDRPAMISGATGAVAVVMPTITRKCIDYSALYGGPAAPCTEPRFATPTRLGVLFYAIILQGILQFVFGMLQMGKFALLLPHPSMVGFCNGLGLIIFFAQFEAFKLGDLGRTHPAYCSNVFDHPGEWETRIQIGEDFMLNKEWCSSPQALAVGHVAYPEWTSDPMVMAKGNEMGWAGWNITADAAGVAAVVDEGRRQLGGSYKIFTDGHAWMDGQTIFYMLVCIILPTMLSIHAAPALFKRIPPFYNDQLIPSSLVGIGVSMLIEHLILRNADADCDLVRDPVLDFAGEQKMWIGCGTKTVAEVAMVAGEFPVPIWADTTIYETYPGSGVQVRLMDSLPAIDGDLLSEILPVSITLAIIGLIESLMTQILLNQKLGSDGNASRECIGQGTANIIAGGLGSMGGCVTIGQAMINVASGAKTRFSSVWAAFVLLMIILVAYPVIDLIPLAGLVGVMFNMIFFHIFDWASLKFLVTAVVPESMRGMPCMKFLGLDKLKVNRVDSFCVVIVAVVSVFTDLAVGVGCGVAFCSLMFAWEHGKQIKVKHGDGGAIEGKGGYTDAPAADMKSCAWDGDNGLTKEQREAATLLGLDKQKWNNKVGPDFAWEEKMTMPEGKKPEETDEGKAVTANLAAAKKLGWSQKNWESVAKNCYMVRSLYIEGTLFFGSARVFQNIFTPELMEICPKTVYLNFDQGEITDFSAIEALRGIAELYDERGKTIHLFEVSGDSMKIVEKGAGHSYEGCDFIIAGDAVPHGFSPFASKVPTSAEPAAAESGASA